MQIPIGRNYYATNDGEIWVIRNSHLVQLSQFPNGDQKAPSVTLKIGGKAKTKKVSILVALAWIGEPPLGKPLVLHKDDNPWNNNWTNLVYGTQQENMDQKARRNRQAKGSIHGMSKLTEDDIPVIRERYAKGETQTAIAEDYGVTYRTIGYVTTGKWWSHC